MVRLILILTLTLVILIWTFQKKETFQPVEKKETSKIEINKSPNPEVNHSKIDKYKINECESSFSEKNITAREGGLKEREVLSEKKSRDVATLIESSQTFKVVEMVNNNYLQANSIINNLSVLENIFLTSKSDIFSVSREMRKYNIDFDLVSGAFIYFDNYRDFSHFIRDMEIDYNFHCLTAENYVQQHTHYRNYIESLLIKYHHDEMVTAENIGIFLYNNEDAVTKFIDELLERNNHEIGELEIETTMASLSAHENAHPHIKKLIDQGFNLSSNSLFIAFLNNNSTLISQLQKSKVQLTLSKEDYDEILHLAHTKRIKNETYTLLGNVTIE
jgi:hypothetical protein